MDTSSTPEEEKGDLQPEEEDQEEQEEQEEQEKEEQEEEQEEKKRKPRKSKNRIASLTLISGNRYKDAQGVIFRKYDRLTPFGTISQQFVKERPTVQLSREEAKEQYDPFFNIFKSELVSLFKKVRPDKKTLQKIKLLIISEFEQLLIEREHNSTVEP